jgi:hypothetical protein
VLSKQLRVGLLTLHTTLHEAEKLIREARSGGAEIRSNCIYAWECAEMAESNWRIEKAKHLYELEICEADILHRGNAVHVFDLRSAEESLKAALAKRYWEEPGQEKYVELLVRKARVLRKLKDKSDPRTPLVARTAETDEEFDTRISLLQPKNTKPPK